MTSFSTAVQAASLLSLVSLLLYTLWLMRAGRLSAHLTVRWMLAEGAAMLGVIVWSWLPFFSFTSGLDDRELLVILAVLLFVLIAFLMLDSLARISTHTQQIKRLTQEVALLRAGAPPPGASDDAMAASQSPTLAQDLRASPRGKSDWPQLLAVAWIGTCVGFFVLEMSPPRFPFLKAWLSANFLQ